MIDGNRLNGGSPSNPVYGNGAISLSYGKAESEVAVVVAQPTCVERVRSIQETDLAKHGIPIDKHFVSHAEVVIPQPTRTGDVDQQVPVAEPLAGYRFPGSVKLSIGTVPVNPGMIEVEIVEDFFQGLQREGSVRCDCSGLGIVRPCAGVLQIGDLVAQGTEAEQVLEVVPDHSPKGILPDQTRDDDAHKPSL